MDRQAVIEWLLEGDVSIQYQTRRDLLGEDNPELQQRIATEGWGARLLAARGSNGHWGRGFYQPKWISSHYTLLDLKNLGLPRGVAAVDDTIRRILHEIKAPDGGVNPAITIPKSDVCVNGMLLHYAAWFGAPEEDLKSVVDYLLTQHMPDGGFNCALGFTGARHSSLHSTLSVAEGIAQYAASGYTYRLAELQAVERACREFMLMHRLFRSDRTGAIINPAFLRWPYPARWHYDTLRALDYFKSVRHPYDPRMDEALDHLFQKRKKDGRWALPSHYPGLRHFDMETVGQPSRWNTLRGERVGREWGENRGRIG